MRAAILISLVTMMFTINALYAQNNKIYSAETNAQNFNMERVYERGAPPDLYCDLDFSDENGNSILEAEETAELRIKLTNKGKGVAQGMEIRVLEEYAADPNLKIDVEHEVYYLYPEQSVEFKIPIKAGFYIKSAEHKFKILVMEHFSYDMDPAYLLLNTLEYQSPKLAFAGYEVIDAGENTMALQEDGQLQLGEQVQIKINIQNRGQNIARNVRYKVISKDMNNVYLETVEGELGDLKVNDLKDFRFQVAPGKRIDPNKPLPLFLTLNVEKDIGGMNDFQIPIYPNQKPPKTEIHEVKPNYDELQKQMGRFEVTSNKFTTKINAKDIRIVPAAKKIRADAVGIIFGIEKYTELSPAKYAENDALIMEKYFKDLLGIDKVVTIINEESDDLDFDKVFNPKYGQLKNLVIKDKTDIFVFYSGHGLPSSDGEQVYLFPSNGMKARLESDGYNIDTLYKSLEALEARSVTVFLDACFSGESRFSETIPKENIGGFKGVKVKPKIYKPWEADSTFSVFSSSGFEETSCIFDPSQTGLFTYYLCAGLSGDADFDNNKKITFKELERYVGKEVQETSKKYSSVGQTPEFHGNSELILVDYNFK